MNQNNRPYLDVNIALADWTSNGVKDREIVYTFVLIKIRNSCRHFFCLKLFEAIGAVSCDHMFIIKNLFNSAEQPAIMASGFVEILVQCETKAFDIDST